METISRIFGSKISKQISWEVWLLIMVINYLDGFQSRGSLVKRPD